MTACHRRQRDPSRPSSRAFRQPAYRSFYADIVIAGGLGQPAEGRCRARGRPLQGRDRALQHCAEKGDPILFANDEFINKKTNAEALASLLPTFYTAGSVTAGNATGCRISATSLHDMQRRNAEKASASLRMGGGMRVVLTVER